MGLSTEIILLCIKVFLCRIFDVSCSTFRTVLLVKGHTKTAALIAVVEAFAWFWIIKDALNLPSPTLIEKFNVALAYALGFSIGNMLGGTLSKYIDATVNVQVVLSSKNNDVIKKIQEAGYEITVIEAAASQYSGEKFIVFAVIDRKNLIAFRKLIKELDNKAFILASDTRIVRHALGHSVV